MTRLPWTLGSFHLSLAPWESEVVLADTLHRLSWTARIALVLLVAVPIAACGFGPRIAPGTTPGIVPGASTSPAQSSAAAPIVATAGPLSVSITSPANDTVVNTPQVVLTGTAPPDTVITIDDTIVVVDASGQFSATVSLDTGPNELAIEASDPAGNEASSQLIVTYEPAG